METRGTVLAEIMIKQMAFSSAWKVQFNQGGTDHD
jgi:hypothetical protein